MGRRTVGHFQPPGAQEFRECIVATVHSPRRRSSFKLSFMKPPALCRSFRVYKQK